MSQQQPLRIIHCFRSPVGGIFRHVRDLIIEHAKAGHHVGILCDSSTGGALEEQLFEEIKPHLKLGLNRIPISRSIKPSDLIALWKSYLHIKSLRPDIIHGHGAKGGTIARIIGTGLRVGKYRVARLYSPHGGSLHYDKTSIKGRAIFLIERLLERFTDAICFVCDFERKTYTQKIGQPLPLYRRIYNGVNEEEFAPVTLAPNAADFLFIGMMRDLKGPHIFIESLSILNKGRSTPASAVMVGDGPDIEKYRKLIKSLGLSNQISLIEPKPTREAFSLGQVVVIPSLAEALPYIVLEASAAQKPIIASAVGGIPEILSHDNIGLCPPGDADALAKLMHDALSDPLWIENSRQNSAEFKEKFSSKHMCEEISNLYQKLL